MFHKSPQYGPQYAPGLQYGYQWPGNYQYYRQGPHYPSEHGAPVVPPGPMTEPPQMTQYGPQPVQQPPPQQQPAPTPTPMEVDATGMVKKPQIFLINLTHTDVQFNSQKKNQKPLTVKVNLIHRWRNADQYPM